MKRPVSVFIRTGPALGRRSEMLYGHFIEQEDMETMQANAQDGRAETVEVLDVPGTRFTSDGTLAFAAVNKDPFEEKALVLHPGTDGAYCWRQITVWGESTESYNDIGHTEVELKEGEWREGNGSLSVSLKAHSVHVIQIRKN